MLDPLVLFEGVVVVLELPLEELPLDPELEEPLLEPLLGL